MKSILFQKVGCKRKPTTCFESEIREQFTGVMTSEHIEPWTYTNTRRTMANKKTTGIFARPTVIIFDRWMWISTFIRAKVQVETGESIGTSIQKCLRLELTKWMMLAFNRHGLKYKTILAKFLMSVQHLDESFASFHEELWALCDELIALRGEDVDGGKSDEPICAKHPRSVSEKRSKAVHRRERYERNLLHGCSRDSERCSQRTCGRGTILAHVPWERRVPKQASRGKGCKTEGIERQPTVTASRTVNVEG